MHPAETFVAALAGSVDTPASVCTFVALPDHPACDVRPTIFRGVLADYLEPLQRLNAKGAGIFIMVNDTKGRRRRKVDVTAVRALFVDGDKIAKPASFACEASIVQSRAELKWHVYWRLVPCEDMRRWEPAMRALAAFYGTDTSVCDLARVMRLPGFLHTKDPEHQSPGYTIHSTTAATYAIDDVLEAHFIDPKTITPETAVVSVPVAFDSVAITDATRAALLSALDALPGTARHNQSLGWVIDAVAAGLPDEDIAEAVEAWMAEHGREPQTHEIPNMIRDAKVGLTTGTRRVRTPGIRPDLDFVPTTTTGTSAPTEPKPLPPAEAKAQAESLVEWEQDLLVDAYKKPKSCEYNCDLILRKHNHFRGCLRWNEFSYQVEVAETLPWARRTDGVEWTDTDDTRFVLWVTKAYGVSFEVAKVRRAVVAVAKHTPYHPVRNYLRSLVWDGTPRLTRWLTTYLGTPDTAYARLIGAKLLISAVARVMVPGCKVDTVAVLEGDQGIGKSTALSILGGAWFSDGEIDLSSKDASALIRGQWIYELGELNPVRRAEKAQLKSFLSRRVDRQRDAYAARPESIPRQGIFIGSTNQDEWLTDETGNRRFWPIRTGVDGQIDHEALRRDRDQLWAEALIAYDLGESWWLTQDEEKHAVVEQAARYSEDAWTGAISAWLAKGGDFDRTDGKPVEPITQCTSRRVWLEGLGGQDKGLDRATQLRIGAVMRTLGYRSQAIYENGVTVKGYKKC